MHYSVVEIADTNSTSSFRNTLAASKKVLTTKLLYTFELLYQKDASCNKPDRGLISESVMQLHHFILRDSNLVKPEK